MLEWRWVKRTTNDIYLRDAPYVWLIESWWNLQQSNTASTQKDQTNFRGLFSSHAPPFVSYGKVFASLPLFCLILCSFVRDFDMVKRWTDSSVAHWPSQSCRESIRKSGFWHFASLLDIKTDGHCPSAAAAVARKRCNAENRFEPKRKYDTKLWHRKSNIIYLWAQRANRPMCPTSIQWRKITEMENTMRFFFVVVDKGSRLRWIDDSAQPVTVEQK